MNEPYSIIRMRPLKPESEWAPEEPEPRRLTWRQYLIWSAFVFAIQVAIVIAITS